MIQQGEEWPGKLTPLGHPKPRHTWAWVVVTEKHLSTVGKPVGSVQPRSHHPKTHMRTVHF